MYYEHLFLHSKLSLNCQEYLQTKISQIGLVILNFCTTKEQQLIFISKKTILQILYYKF